MSTRLTTRDGLALHLVHHAVPGAVGSVLVVHGLGEHLGRYAALARHLSEGGGTSAMPATDAPTARWAVSLYDHRGHGRSEGPRGGIAADDDLLADLALAWDDFVNTQPGPHVLLGHSLGGLVAARFVAEAQRPASERAPWQRKVDALVLSSPALDPGLSPFQRLLIATLPRLAPGLTVGNGLNPAWVSRDPAVVAAYRADPLVHDRINARLARFIAQAGQTVLALAPQWRTPTLLMWAGADRCVAPRGSAAFAAAAPATVVQPCPWPGLAHEIFNEPEAPHVRAALSDWLVRLPR